ncbi:MAG: SGNH/GDSL hydrolase family protein [Proteobacteria bacterium]|nr:SGNH/GDSL hydrolase family protein [Pseudomonadota bacterium]
MASKPRIRLRAKILYAIILVITVAGALVLADRYLLLLFSQTPDRETFLMGIYARPDTWEDDVRINSMGFAEDVLSPEKPPGTLRVLCLGGSAFFNRNMATRLKRKLQEQTDAPVEVLGGALRTHNTRSSLIKYALLAKYDFDYVFIYHGINDVAANHVPPEYFRDDYSHFNAWYVRGGLLEHSVIARVLYDRFCYETPVRKYQGSGFASRGTFYRNISLLVDAVRSNGSIPVIMTFAYNLPENYTHEGFLESTVGYFNPEHYDAWPVELWGDPEYVKQCLDFHNDAIRRIARGKNVPFIDVEALMGKDLYWFGDVCHFSEPGTERFLQGLADFWGRR